METYITYCVLLYITLLYTLGVRVYKVIQPTHKIAFMYIQTETNNYLEKIELEKRYTLNNVTFIDVKDVFHSY